MPILDKVSFSDLKTPEAQKLAEDIKEAFVEICPNNDTMSNEYAEAFSFKVTKGIDEFFEKFKVKLMQEIDAKIQAAQK
jgi:hypothetical protein